MVVRNLPVGKVAAMPGIKKRYFSRVNLDVVRAGALDDGSCFYHTLFMLLANGKGVLGGGRVAPPLKHDPANKIINAKKRVAGRQLRAYLERGLTEAAWRKFWQRKVGNNPAALAKVPSAAKVKEKMRKTRQWADVYVIAYVMDKLNMNIMFFDMTTGKVYCGVENFDKSDPTRKNGFVAWVGRSHFEPVAFVDPRDPESFQTVFPNNHPLVTHLIHKYVAEECPTAKLAAVLGGGQETGTLTPYRRPAAQPRRPRRRAPDARRGGNRG